MFSNGKQDCNVRKKWGYTFQWTDNHLSREELDHLKASHDERGSAVAEKLRDIAAKTAFKSSDSKAPNKPDLFALLREHHGEDDLLASFWNEIGTVPHWVDWKQIDRGQKLLSRYIIANSVGVMIQGFIRGNAVSPGVSEVLIRTGGIATKNLLPRVMESFKWFVDITDSLSSIQPGGTGHESTIRVRLLHATVRHRILKLNETRPGYYPVEKYGVPVNDLDSTRSITLFCCSPLWDSLPKMGIYPTKQEIVDYVALFRYVSFLIGTPTQYWESPERAKAVMETMIIDEGSPTKNSEILAKNFLHWVEDTPPVCYSRDLIEAACRVMMGHEMCDELKLGRPSVYYYMAFKGHNMILSTLARVQQLFPTFDEKVVKFFRKQMSGTLHGSNLLDTRNPFAFRYLPKLGVKYLEEDDASEKGTPQRVLRVFEHSFVFTFVLSYLAFFLIIWILLAALQHMFLSR